MAHPGTPPGLSPNLNELLLFQVPLLDAIVSGTTEQYISLDGQAFDTIIVRGLKVVGWANGARYTVAQLEHLRMKRGQNSDKGMINQSIRAALEHRGRSHYFHLLLFAPFYFLATKVSNHIQGEQAKLLGSVYFLFPPIYHVNGSSTTHSEALPALLTH